MSPFSMGTADEDRLHPPYMLQWSPEDNSRKLNSLESTARGAVDRFG